tara:strand:+ start:179 stop:469 length:291 start_codon:yes stop_codon:yes gene_type:complete
MSRRQKVHLTKEEEKELQKIVEEINEEAKNVVEDYANNPSEISGSVVQVNEESPYLDTKYKSDGWKKIIKGGVNEALSYLKNIKSKKKLAKKKKKS